jgi:hypothetical protein
MLPTPEQMQAFADEMKAKADSLPEGHPEKARLLHDADLASYSARRRRWREFFEADGDWEDINAAMHFKRMRRLN